VAVISEGFLIRRLVTVAVFLVKFHKGFIDFYLVLLILSWTHGARLLVLYFFLHLLLIANIIRIMGKDNPWVPVTRMGKGMGKNSYPCMGMGKLAGKIFSRG
jgi:hypothetical protein